jgi:hypothetical protein
VLVWSLKDMAAQACEQGVMPLGDFFVGGWQSSATLAREEIGMAWQTAALRMVGYDSPTQVDPVAQRRMP